MSRTSGWLAGTRGYRFALACSGTAALIAGLVYGQGWLVVTYSAAGLPRQTAVLTGRALQQGQSLLWLVALASAAAIIATKTWGRRAAGALLALAGVYVMVGSLRFGLDPEGAAQSWLATQPTAEILSALSRSWWLAAEVAGLLSVVAGVSAVAFGDTWPSMGSRFGRAGEPRPSSEGDRTAPSSIDTWKALDRGEDPTA